MLEGFESAMRDRFRVEEYSKVNKVCDLGEAIQKNVRPGMTHSIWVWPGLVGQLLPSTS